MHTIIYAAACLVGFFLASPVLAQPAPFELKLVSDGFKVPLFVTSPPGDARLFVVEQNGAIRVLEGGAIKAQPFLDIHDLISTSVERGLLGLAFHPDYASNGRFFINYTDLNGDTQIAAYTVSSNPDVADPNSATPILLVDQPRTNNKGGWLAFGPDGYLYIGMGDGGGAFDAEGYAQNLDMLLGKILRLDVNSRGPYAIPPDNPFVNGGGKPEIFVTGVRNPWRMAFDGNDLYVADVGQNHWEEIHVISLDDKGANLGWNTMEGAKCLLPATTCDQSGLVLPVHVYSHDEGCSVIGGYVYRGAAIPEIEGHYFYSDYCSGMLSSFRHTADGLTDLSSYAEDFGAIGEITSFGLDSKGELYLVTQAGALMQLVPR
jgi:glucose/arabinose dehydrogenase